MMLQFLLKGKFILFNLAVLLMFSSCKRDELIVDQDASRLPVSDLKVDYAFDMQIGLSWGDADYDGTYYVYMAKNTSDIDSMKFFTWSSEKFVDITVSSYDTEYFFTVSKSMENTNSIFSNIVSAKPVNIYKPGSPIFLNSQSLNSDSMEIVLSWENRDSDISFAEIYRNKSGVFNYETDLLAVKDRYPSTFNDTMNLIENTTYYYSIILYDFGGLKSQPSIPFSNFIMDKPEIIFPLDNQDISPNDTIIYKTNSSLRKHFLNIMLENNDTPNDELITIEHSPNSASEIVKVPIKGLGLSLNKIYRIVLFAGRMNALQGANNHDQYSNTLINFRIK